MTANQKTNLPKMKADVGFSLGFFCGAILSAIGVYLAVSPDGKKLKQRLATEFNEHQRNLILASVMPANKKAADIPKLAVKIRSWIKQVRLITDKTPDKPVLKTPNNPIKRKHHFKQK